MRKKILFLLLFAVFLIGIPLVSSAQNQFESFETLDNTFDVNSPEAYSQSIHIRNQSFSVTNISIYFSSGSGGKPNVTLIVKAVNSTGEPTGGNLTQGSHTFYSSAGAGSWINISVPSYSLTNNTNYSIIILTNDTVGINMQIAYATDLYPFGHASISNNRGVSWTINYAGATGYDLGFRLYGGTADVSGQVINRLIAPANMSSIFINSVNFSSNYTGTNIKSFINATYFIYNSSGEFDVTKVTVNNATNMTSLNVSSFILGNYKWNVYACARNLSDDPTCFWGNLGNFTFQIEGSIVDQSYNNITYETQTEQFQANFSLFPGTNMISVNLVYNGTSYVVSDITSYGTIIELKRTIDIPVNPNPYASYNNTWFWSFTFSNGGLTNQNTTLKNQTINPLNIVFCNATYLQGGINFTTYDETNPNPIILSTFHTFWSFWIGSGTIKKNYSYEDTSVTKSSYKFCINPNQSTIYTNLNSEITSPGFFPRTYHLSNATINNVTQQVPIRLINDTLGVKFFHTIRQGVSRISGAIIIISKIDVGIGTWVVVGIRQSDDDGQFIEYLELDKDYTYSISKDGTFLGNIEKNAMCSATPCLVNLDLETDSTNLWNGYYDAYAPNVVYNLTYNKTSHNVTYTFVDTSGLATYFRLQVNKVSANESGALICDKSLYAIVGTLTCDLTGETGGFIAKGFVSRSPEKLVAVLYGILNALTEIIGKNEGLFFTLLIVLVVGMIGAFNPVIGVILAGMAFIFASIMGFVMVSVIAIILVAILMILLVIKMGRQGV